MSRRRSSEPSTARWGKSAAFHRLIYCHFHFFFLIWRDFLPHFTQEDFLNLLDWIFFLYIMQTVGNSSICCCCRCCCFPSAVLCVGNLIRTCLKYTQKTVINKTGAVKTDASVFSTDQWTFLVLTVDVLCSCCLFGIWERTKNRQFVQNKFPFFFCFPQVIKKAQKSKTLHG